MATPIPPLKAVASEALSPDRKPGRPRRGFASRLVSAFKGRVLPSYDLEVRGNGVGWRTGKPVKSLKLVRIDRSLCRHTHIKRIPGVNLIEEAKSAHLKARATAPFKRTQFALLWSRSSISIFAWDQDRVDALLASQNITLPKTATLLPSSFFSDPGQGLLLREYQTGYEAQAWEDGALVLSRWWHSPPSMDQINTLVLASDLAFDPASIQVVPGQMAAHPTQFSWRNVVDHVSLFRSQMLASFLAINLLLVCYEAGAGLSLLASQPGSQPGTQSTPSGAGDGPATKSKDASIIDARKRALDNRKWIQSYLGLRGVGDHLSILSTFLQTIEGSAQTATVEAWEFDNGQLAVTLKSPEKLDVKELVTKLQGQGLFDSVNSDSAAVPGTIKLVMMVKGARR